MNKVRVYRTANDLAIMHSEGFGVVAELYDLGGAYKWEIERIEEEQQPFGFVICEGELFELACWWDPAVGFEEGSRFADYCFYRLTCHKIYQFNWEFQRQNLYFY